MVQATIGCTFRCTFCMSNLRKQFEIRPLEEIIRDLEIAARESPFTRRIFLLDGNGFVMKADMIVEICKKAYELFPRLERVGAYAHAKDIIKKTPEELKAIADAGFGIVYLGIETGDDELLKEVKKQTTADEMVQAAQMIHKAGIELSGTVILGLAGPDPERSKRHAIETAKVINRMNPPKKQRWYISALTLMVPEGTALFDQMQKGEFEKIDSQQALNELYLMIKHSSDDLHGCVFRSNHASNYLPIKGTLAADKQKILKTIKNGLDNPDVLRPEFFRAL